jgi:hypothetical protein
LYNVSYKIFTNKKAAVIFAIFISLGLVWRILLPDWSFLSYELRAWESCVTEICISYLIIFIIITSKNLAVKVFTAFVGFPIIIIFTILFIIVGNKPIDTFTEPKDICVLKKIDKHEKIVVREFENTEGDKDYDTALVDDYFIFRKELSATKPHIEILAP